MYREELRAALSNIYGEEELLLFDNPSFDDSIVGVDEFDGPRVVYDYFKMVNEYSLDNDCSLEEAMEFIDYNTVRSLAYYKYSPIIMNPIQEII